MEQKIQYINLQTLDNMIRNEYNIINQSNITPLKISHFNETNNVNVDYGFLNNWIDLMNNIIQYDKFEHNNSLKNKNYIMLDFYWQFYLKLRYVRTMVNNANISEQIKYNVNEVINYYMEHNLLNVKSMIL